MPDCQFGARTKLTARQRTKPYPFLVTEDLTWPIVPVLPTRERTSKNAWTEPTTVVDWVAVERQYGVGHVNFVQQNLLDPDAFKQLVGHIIFRYVIGCGGDIPDRNFHYNKHAHSVYSLDEENIGNEWLLTGGLKGFKLDTVRGFLREHWEGHFKALFAKWHQAFAGNLGTFVRASLPIDSALWSNRHWIIKLTQFVKGRLPVLLDLEVLCQLLTRPPKEAREEEKPKKPKKASTVAQEEEGTILDFLKEEEVALEVAKVEAATPRSQPAKRKRFMTEKAAAAAAAAPLSSSDDEDSSDVFRSSEEEGSYSPPPAKLAKPTFEESAPLKGYPEYPLPLPLLDYAMGATVPCAPGLAVAKHRVGRSASGTALDVVKSDLQKAIRMGRASQALMAFFELYNMPTIFPNSSTAKGNQTNVLNRIVVCAMEDIGPANIPLVIAICDQVKLHTTALASRGNDVGNQAEVMKAVAIYRRQRKYDGTPQALAALVEQMALSPKSRLASHLWHAYGCPANDQLRTAKGLNFTVPSVDGLSSNMIVATLVNELRERNMGVFRIAYIAFQFESEKKKWEENAKDGKKNKTKAKPSTAQRCTVVHIWCALENVLPAALYDTLAFEYATLSEKRPALQLALTVALWGKRTQQAPYSIADGAFRWINTIALKALRSGDYVYKNHPSAVDKHTAEGKRQGADRLKFVTEGALVANEAPEYMDAKLLDIYINSLAD